MFGDVPITLCFFFRPATVLTNLYLGAKTYMYFPYFQIVAIASKSLEKAKTYRERFAIRKAYGTYDEVAKDPEVGL